MSKLFQVTILFLVAIISVTLLAVLFSAVLSGLPLPMISHSDGIGAVAGGVSEKWLRLVFLLAVLIGVSFLYWRGRKKSR